MWTVENSVKIAATANGLGASRPREGENDPDALIMSRSSRLFLLLLIMRLFLLKATYGSSATFLMRFTQFHFHRDLNKSH